MNFWITMYSSRFLLRLFSTGPKSKLGITQNSINLNKNNTTLLTVFKRNARTRASTAWRNAETVKKPSSFSGRFIKEF